jgi:HUS1 checkpoint protein
MRFKAKLAPEQVSLLHSLIVPMTRLGGSGSENGGSGGGGGVTQSAFSRNGTILYLDSDHVRLSCKGRTSDTDGMSCFAELAAVGFHSIFLDRRIESAAPNNAIVMELDLAQLRLALKSVMSDTNTASATANTTVGSNNAASSFIQGGIHGAAAAVALEVQYTVLKLAKRQNIPCLCIDACSSGGGSGNTAWIQVHHAIPVRIVRHSEMPSHMPPQISLPDVQLELNHHQHHLRIVVDRLKRQSNSPTVYLEGSMKGALTVRSHTDGCAALQTYFGQLTPRLDNCSDRTDASTIRQVKVDTKKLATALAWQQPQSQNMVQSALLCLVENEMLVVHVNLNPENVGFFTYYVPVHFLSSDPCED